MAHDEKPISEADEPATEAAEPATEEAILAPEQSASQVNELVKPLRKSVPPYDQNIVLDLEFTPVNRSERTPEFRYEIIQIGAVRVSPQGNVLDNFCIYVKPEFTTLVSRKVQQLTGIRTSDATAGLPIKEALEEFRTWIGEVHTRFVAWSNSDLVQFVAETNKKKINFPEKNSRWLDLQKIYPRFMDVGNGKCMALHVAADWYGIQVSEEELHGALYDAQVTAELLASLITKDYLKQKHTLAEVMPDAKDAKATTFSIGDKFSALSKLKAELEAKGA